MTIGERIRHRRIELNMTQDELAKKVGYASRSSINKIEAARELPSRKIVAMAKALECSPSYLMGWIAEDDSSPVLDACARMGVQDGHLFEDMLEIHKHKITADTEDEKDLLLGYRSASSERQHLMLQMAIEVLEKKSDFTPDEEDA